MPFWIWSKTSALNSSIDSTINLSEGMSPSAVNDSARAIMARAAEFRDDMSGLLATAGTSTAYTVTTNQGLNSVPNDGQLIAVTVHATNGAAVTLTADGGTTYPIWSAPSVPVPAATMILGSPYTLKFSTSYSAWMLRDFYASPTSIPIGGLLPYFGSTSPNSNFILPAAQAISRTAYAAFFTLVGTTYGAGDGVNTFNVPDLRGRTIAAIDNLGGSAASRLTTTYFGSDPTVLGNVGGVQSNTILQTNLPNLSLSVTIPSGQGSHGHDLPFGAAVSSPGGGAPFNYVKDGSGYGASNNTLPQMTGTAATGGGGTPISRIMPAMVMIYLLRVL